MATKDSCGCSVRVYEEINALTLLFELNPNVFSLLLATQSGNTLSVGTSTMFFWCPFTNAGAVYKGCRIGHWSFGIAMLPVETVSLQDSQCHVTSAN